MHAGESPRMESLEARLLLSAPVVAIHGAPAESNEGTAIALTSEVTDADTGQWYYYAWSVLKDGQNYPLGDATVDAAAFVFTPDNEGAYDVSLLVTDSGGEEGSALAAISVLNVAPVVELPSGAAGS
ncbi:MAG TPA: PKD domain-containing protein, partial [Phycisphaerae bacterium]|nr:PKD domain-containing protein [Phycisphaerae bacterium]